MAVVDHTGKVHGIDGLYICDASIFPALMRANTNVPTTVVAEHLARGDRADRRRRWFMTVLVIGGMGFIGRRVVRRLADAGARVVCMDVNPGQASFAENGEQIKFVAGDVTAFDDVVKAIFDERPERIINLAYLLGESDQKPHLAVRLNILGMDNVFEAARLCGVKRVVFASSIGYHGHSQTTHGDRLLTEEDPPAPGSMAPRSSSTSSWLATTRASMGRRSSPSGRASSLGRASLVASWSISR
jgi:hypothetical protein